MDNEKRRRRKEPVVESFEAALEELEKSVQQLESGALPLEEALRIFANGMEKSAFCLEKTPGGGTTDRSDCAVAEWAIAASAMEEQGGCGMTFEQYCRQQLPQIEKELEAWLGQSNCRLNEAMAYSVFAGGKRLRPILLLAAADAVGGNGAAFTTTAAALEVIHTYSLIHDDLPAMDNDDYRRGRLTNHKVYGEGMAILAGDGLLTLAFEMLAKQGGVTPATILQVVQEIAAAAGPAGMVGGQSIDMEAEGKQLSLAELQTLHARKTGALFRAAVRSGAILAGASAEQLAALTTYAEAFGLAFQITDDILDVLGDQAVMGKPTGSDEKNNKATYVTMFSLGQAQTMAQETVATAVQAVEGFGPRAEVLVDLAQLLLRRKS